MVTNRWRSASPATRKKWAVGLCAAVLIGGCIFAGSGDAALVSSMSFGQGDIVALSNSLTWLASNGAMQTIPPLAAGQELVQGSYTEHLLGYEVVYQGASEINNTEIIRQSTAREITAGKVVYSESVLHSGFRQSDNPGILCADLPEPGTAEVPEAETANVTDGVAAGPYNIPYCESVLVGSAFLSDSLAYQSSTELTSLDITNDALHVRMAGSGAGTGTIYAGGYSMAGYSNCSSLGYTNQFSERMIVTGKDMQIGKVFDWSSFANTFDFPAAEGENPA
jgi:hypothetical protein